MQHHVVGVLCYRKDWCDSRSCGHHEEAALLKDRLETFTESKSLHAKIQSTLVAIWLNDNKIGSLMKWLKVGMSRAEKVCASRVANKPESVTLQAN